MLLSFSLGDAAADQWGCEVLLCLSNPAGPTAVPECKPPIHRLWKHLRDGHDFPSCDMARGPDGASFAKRGFSYYDPCPTGTQTLAAGEPATKTGEQNASRFGPYYSVTNPVHVGIGNGDRYPPRQVDGTFAPKVCVSRKLGVVRVSNDPRNSYEVSVYDQVTLLPAQRSPRFIDVYVNDAFYQRVRW